jgi:hypothetical protein
MLATATILGKQQKMVLAAVIVLQTAEKAEDDSFDGCNFFIYSHNPDANIVYEV